MSKTKRIAPSDDLARKAWDEIMRIASDHALISAAYSGTAVLVMPADQREHGMRERILEAHCMIETPFPGRV